MKRVIAMMLLLVMIPAACFASDRAETIKQVVDYAKYYLGNFISTCESYPDYFDDDYTFMLYSYYKMYIAANRAYTAELIDNIKVASGLKHNVLDDTTKGQESLFRVLYDYVDDAYYKWLAGEMSTKEFSGLVAAIAKSAIKAEDEVKEAMK